MARRSIWCMIAPTTPARPPAGGQQGRDDHVEDAGRRATAQGSLRTGRVAPARPCAGEHVRLDHPPRAARPAAGELPGRGRPDLGDRRGGGSASRDGRRRQLQRHLGGPRPADLALRRPQAVAPHRRLRCFGHRLGGRLQGEALEGRRRGHRPLQPGRWRRRGVQWRRPDVLLFPAHLGLRDAGRLLRAVLPGAVAPAHGQAEAPLLGGGGLLHADARHRLPHALRPRPHTIKPGDNVLVWGASGGLGVFGVQLCAARAPTPSA